MDLKNLPANTCPLCRQAALDQSTDQWTCDFCGCKLEYDPASRRSLVTYWPAQYANLKAGVGSDWLSRRDLFERVDAAAAIASPERQPKLIGPLLIVASALLLVCVMLGAVASALVISPSIARTRRVISQAYRPTATATITPTATMTAEMPADGVATTQPALTSPLTTTDVIAEGMDVLTSTTEMIAETPTLMPTPELPTPTPPQAVAPQPEQPLPPTFTPVLPTPTLTPPPVEAPTATPAANPANPQSSPLPQPQTPAPVPPGATQAAPTPLPPQNPAVPPTPVTPAAPAAPLVPGSQLFSGAVQVVSVFATGNAGLNEADEYVELRNVGQTPAYLDGWKLKAIRNADNVQLEEYTFPGGSVIAANQTCRIYTNLPYGQDNCGFSGGFAFDQPLWPPNGARAVLVNPQGQEMSRFVY